MVLESVETGWKACRNKYYAQGPFWRLELLCCQYRTQSTIQANVRGLSGPSTQRLVLSHYRKAVAWIANNKFKQANCSFCGLSHWPDVLIIQVFYAGGTNCVKTILSQSSANELTMSKAHRQRLAKLEKKHGHQISRDSDTRFSKDILVAGAQTHINVKNHSIEMIFGRFSDVRQAGANPCSSRPRTCRGGR